MHVVGLGTYAVLYRKALEQTKTPCESCEKRDSNAWIFGNCYMIYAQQRLG